jgi:hypothetical protein
LEVKLTIGPFTTGGPYISNHVRGPRTLRPGDVGDDLLLVVEIRLPPDTEGSCTGALLIGSLLSPHPARVVVPRSVWTSTARRPPKSKQVALPVCKHELLRPKELKFIDVVRQ